MSDNMTIIEQNSEINRKRPHDEEIIEWTENRTKSIYRKTSSNMTITDQNSETNRKRERDEEIIESPSKFEVKRNCGDGDCLFHSVLDHIMGETIFNDDAQEQLNYLNNHSAKDEYKDSDIENTYTRKILYLRNKVVDKIDALEGVRIPGDSISIRKLGIWNEDAFDEYPLKVLPNIIGKPLCIYNNDISHYYRVDEVLKEKSIAAIFSNDVNTLKYIPIKFERNHYESFKFKDRKRRLPLSNREQKRVSKKQKAKIFKQKAKIFKEKDKNVNQKTLEELLMSYKNEEIDKETLLKQFPQSSEISGNTQIMNKNGDLIKELNQNKKERFQKTYDNLTKIVNNIGDKDEIKVDLTDDPDSNVHKISIVDPNSNVSDKLSQLRKVLNEDAIAIIKINKNFRNTDGTFNSEKFNGQSEADMKEFLAKIVGLSCDEEKIKETLDRVNKICEMNNDGILVDETISSDLWNFLSLKKKENITPEFLKNTKKIEELCKEGDEFRFSVVEWIALFGINKRLFHGFIFGLVQSGKTELAWLLLYTHAILLEEKTIFCGPNDNGIMKQNMNGLKFIIEKFGDEKSLKEKFFEFKKDDDIKKFDNEKKGCVMFIKNEPHTLKKLKENLKENFHNLYIDEAHEIFSNKMTTYKKIICKVFNIDVDENVAEKIIVEYMDEKPLGNILNLDFESTIDKKETYQISSVFTNKENKEIGLQVNNGEKSDFFKISFSDLKVEMNIDINEKITVDISAVKQDIWERFIFQKVIKRFGYISATPDACYNCVDSPSLMRFLSPKKNYKSPFCVNDFYDTSNDSIKIINLCKNPIFNWYNTDGKFLTVQNLTKLNEECCDKIKGIFEDIVTKYQKYVIESDYHLPYLSVGVNIFRNIKTQKNFKEKIDGKYINIGGIEYKIEAHVVNSKSNTTIASVFNSFENNPNVKQQKKYPRKWDDELDKKLYEGEMFHEDRYKNVIRIVICDEMNKRGVCNRPEPSQGDGGHFAFIQMLKGVYSNAESNIQYCRIAANGHMFEEHCKRHNILRPPLYLYEDDFIESLLYFVKNNLELCKMTFTSNHDKTLVEAMKLKPETFVVEGDVKSTRQKVYLDSTYTTIEKEQHNFNIEKFNENKGHHIKDFLKIYEIYGFSLFVKKNFLLSGENNQSLSNDLFNYYFYTGRHTPTKFIPNFSGKINDILKEVVNEICQNKSFQIKIKPVDNCEQNCKELTVRINSDLKCAGDETQCIKKIKQQIKDNNAKKFTGEVQLKDLLRAYFQQSHQHMIVFCKDENPEIWKFQNPEKWDSKIIYKIQNKYFTFESLPVIEDTVEDNRTMDFIIYSCLYLGNYKIQNNGRHGTLRSDNNLLSKMIGTYSISEQLLVNSYVAEIDKTFCFIVNRYEFEKYFSPEKDRKCIEIEACCYYDNDRVKHTLTNRKWKFTVKTDQEINEAREQKVKTRTKTTIENYFLKIPKSQQATIVVDFLYPKFKKEENKNYTLTKAELESEYRKAYHNYNDKSFTEWCSSCSSKSKKGNVIPILSKINGEYTLADVTIEVFQEQLEKENS